MPYRVVGLWKILLGAIGPAGVAVRAHGDAPRTANNVPAWWRRIVKAGLAILAVLSLTVGGGRSQARAEILGREWDLLEITPRPPVFLPSRETERQKARDEVDRTARRAAALIRLAESGGAAREVLEAAARQRMGDIISSRGREDLDSTSRRRLDDVRSQFQKAADRVRLVIRSPYVPVDRVFEPEDPAGPASLSGPP